MKCEKELSTTTNGLSEEVRKLAEFTLETVENMYERAVSNFVKNNPLIYLCYADFEEVSRH